jgi:CRP-like cAMP-binding protein
MSDKSVVVPLSRRLDLLSSLPSFEWIPARLLRELCEMLSAAVYQDGEVIVREKEVGDRMFLIESGNVQVSVQGAPGEVSLGRMGPGEAFGEIALVSEPKIRRATVTALGQVVVLALLSSELDRICDQFPEVRETLSSRASELTLERIGALRRARLESL